MSTRQKSFFDQAQNKRTSGPWHHRSGLRPPHHNISKPESAPQRHVTSGPPIMPSSKTKRKLKAFQFDDGALSAEALIKQRQQDKENMPFTTPAKPNAALKPADGPDKTTPVLSHASKTWAPPSTPATRLPLADLVGNEEDSRRLVAKPVSPEEQLCWRGSQPVNTPAPRPRKRKRAQSSSPVAASQDELKLAVPMEEESAEADPIAEAWSQYKGSKGTPSANKAQAFARLIGDSPRASPATGDVGGLRRWASCGDEFPTSASKRRRVRARIGSGLGQGQAPPGDVFDMPSSDSAVQGPEKSRLANILKRMQDSLPRSQAKMPIPPGPPEAEGTSAAGSDQSESPLKNRNSRHQVAKDTMSETQGMEVIAEVDETVLAEEAQPSSCSSDEFGGADFDTEMVEALHVATQQATQQPQTDVFIPTEPLNPAPEPPPQKAPAPSAAVADSDDKFGMDRDDFAAAAGSDDEFGMDEDDFAADLEQVASLYDSRPEVTTPDDQRAQALPPAGARTVAAHVVSLIEDSDDEFGDDIDPDEFAAAEVMATQGQNTSQQDTRAIQRYLIKQVDEGFYTTDRGFQMPEKVLLVEEEKTKLFKAITLRQAWFDTPCAPESFVHVIGQFTKSGQCIIDDHHNMLILHPDHLISATVVADSFGCLRRAVLQDRIKATSKANAPMLFGTLLHELFQEAMKVNRWDTQFLSETIDRLLPLKFETILEINSTCEQVKEHMMSKLPELQTWAKLFICAEPRPDAIVRERNGRQAVMSINKLLDVEEHVWSPMYGLKGNIDATVQVVMQDDKGRRTLTVPFEVKTGKNSSNAAHVAQTALYNLLLSNRYDVEIAYGILYYLETSDISRIPTIRNDIMHMIIKRNELACYVRDRIELPPMLKEDFKCQKCYAQEPCFIYEKLVESRNGELLNTKAKEVYDRLIKYLKPTDQNFMQKWDTLLTKEESDMMKFRRELWTMLSTEREKLGRCFSNVIVEPGSAYEEQGAQKINRYSYTFIKQKLPAGFSFTESQLIVGEPVVVSDEEGHFALANGYVTNVRKHRITVAVDRRLHNSRTRLPGFHSQTNQTFAGVMEVTKEGEPAPIQVPGDDEPPVLYRLDKDEFSNGMAAARNNLIQIMDDNVFKARNLRSLVVELRAPSFKPASEVVLPTQPSQMSMNDDQKTAIAKVMSAEDYALVLGMPGTGKTTTIAHLIRALVAKGKSVLLTSYTHTAVDNILLKFRNDKFGVLRLGATAKVHPKVREFAILGAEPKDSLQELDDSWNKPQVVATTCLSINHPLFNRRIFDYCIVDEASQITLPVCLGPIRMAKTFVLVGDHYQLPPLVQNKEAMEGGLDVSLFKLLCEAHPQAVVNLEHQYRMCDEIMLLSNTFIYSGRLKCGTLAVANRRLELPSPHGLQTHHSRVRPSQTFNRVMCLGPDTRSCWLSRALSPSTPVIFINTDRISHVLEQQSGPRITNSLEARAITHLTVSLLSLGIPADEIGVIAFYRSQLALLRQSLASAHTQTQSSELGRTAGVSAGAGAGVELHTADKFQGRDKEVVLVSCVRSNDSQTVGDLLKDRRRINVALTRARSKLVILGSERTLSSNELLKEMITLCKGNGWVIDLEQDMFDGHIFEENVTQTGRDGAARHDGGANRSVARSPNKSQSPRKKRAVLGDLTMGGMGANKKAPTPSSSPTKSPKKKGLKTPKKVFMAGKKSLLEGRPVLSNLFEEAI